eukprot:6202391-Pleurochrysis_carterae.AAC.4
MITAARAAYVCVRVSVPARPSGLNERRKRCERERHDELSHIVCPTVEASCTIHTNQLRFKLTSGSFMHYSY